jgi:hypothetical protein
VKVYPLAGLENGGGRKGERELTQVRGGRVDGRDFCGEKVTGAGVRDGAD